MGADYYLYTEVKRTDNKWHALNGMYYNLSSCEYEISATYHSGSRTYFGKTCRKLKDIGRIIAASEISPEVRNKEDWVEDNDEIVTVSIGALRNAIPKTSRHQCCGYVHKSHIWAYEVNGEDIDEYLLADEYKDLRDAEQQEYEFYEWDDPTDWHMNLKEILAIIEFQIDEYMRVNCMWDEPADIRLICIESY